MLTILSFHVFSVVAHFGGNVVKARFLGLIPIRRSAITRSRVIELKENQKRGNRIRSSTVLRLNTHSSRANSDDADWRSYGTDNH